MSAAADRFQAEARALIGRRRAEIIAELAGCEPSGPLDPDETPEFMAQVIIEHEAWKAADGHTTPHEEVMRIVLAPTRRWEAHHTAGLSRWRLSMLSPCASVALQVAEALLPEAAGATWTVKPAPAAKPIS